MHQIGEVAELANISTRRANRGSAGVRREEARGPCGPSSLGCPAGRGENQRIDEKSPSIHHSDRGAGTCRSATRRDGRRLGSSLRSGSVGGLLQQRSRRGVVGLYMTEVIRQQGPWRGIEPVEFATLERVDWLNHRRLLEPIRQRAAGREGIRVLSKSSVSHGGLTHKPELRDSRVGSGNNARSTY